MDWSTREEEDEVCRRVIKQNIWRTWTWNAHASNTSAFSRKIPFQSSPFFDSCAKGTRIKEWRGLEWNFPWKMKEKWRSLEIFREKSQFHSFFHNQLNFFIGISFVFSLLFKEYSYQVPYSLMSNRFSLRCPSSMWKNPPSSLWSTLRTWKSTGKVFPYPRYIFPRAGESNTSGATAPREEARHSDRGGTWSTRNSTCSSWRDNNCACRGRKRCRLEKKPSWKLRKLDEEATQQHVDPNYKSQKKIKVSLVELLARIQLETTEVVEIEPLVELRIVSNWIFFLLYHSRDRGHVTKLAFYSYWIFLDKRREFSWKQWRSGCDFNPGFIWN